MRAVACSHFSTERRTRVPSPTRWVCTEYIERYGSHILERSQEGISGTALGNRPGCCVQEVALARRIGLCA